MGHTANISFITLKKNLTEGGLVTLGRKRVLYYLSINLIGPNGIER